MPFIVSFQNFSSWPQSCRIPDATPRNDGVMTAAQAAQLKALVDGGGGGAWVPFDYATGSGYSNYVAPGPSGDIFGPGQSRIDGSMVQLAGIVAVPSEGEGGTSGASIIAVLPVAQRPSKVRIVTCSYQHSSTATAFDLVIDDADGSITGFPGALFVGPSLLGDTFIPLDGLSFLLTQ